MAEVEKKTYSTEDILKLRPGTNVKPENIDSPKVGKKNNNALKHVPKGNRNTVIPPQTRKKETPTPQKKDSIISETIFGIDITVTEIALKQSFTANYSKIVDVSLDVYDSYRADAIQLDRKLCKEELLYYSPALLQMKPLETKAKAG